MYNYFLKQSSGENNKKIIKKMFLENTLFYVLKNKKTKNSSGYQTKFYLLIKFKYFNHEYS